MVDSETSKRGSTGGNILTGIVLTILSVIWVAWLAATPFSNWLPEAAKPADQIDALFKLLAQMGGVTLIYVLGYLLYFCFVFRRRDSDPVDAVGDHSHDSILAEALFWIVPTIMVLVISVYSVQIWAGLQSSPGNALTVEAIGHQFFFEYRYPTLWKPVRDELHLPAGQPVTVKITSADVLHGFWVPEVRLKADMVPGLINNLRFTPDRVGEYRVVCTEFCGIAHGKMVGKFVIQSPADYKNWLSQQAKLQGPPPAEDKTGGILKPAGGMGAPDNGAPAIANGNGDSGKALFAQKCTMCHSVGPYDQKVMGPGLGKLLNDPAHPDLVTGEKASPIAIAHILKNGYVGPLGAMPNQSANGITDQDIANLTAYLVSLSK